MSPSPAFSTEDSDYAFAMDADSNPTARINKFQGTNFHTRKFVMQMVLEERDLWEVTSGEVKMEHCTNAMDQATFKRKSRKALGDHLSRDGRFAVAPGLIGKWRV